MNMDTNNLNKEKEKKYYRNHSQKATGTCFTVYIHNGTFPLKYALRDTLGISNDSFVMKSQRDTLELQKDLIALEEWEKTWGMSFHLDKCNIMRVTRSKNPILFNYHLKGHQLVAADTTKYLGVDLSHDLSWSHHTDRTTKKSNSMLGFPKRNLRITNQETKSAAYFSLVRTNLEYCASIWNPHHKQSIQKLEMTQRRAARYTTNNYTTTSSVNESTTTKVGNSRIEKNQDSTNYVLLNCQKLDGYSS
jgi:hypothetical protein